MKKNKLIKTIKQATAGLLAGAMVLTGVPLGNMTSWAAGVLQSRRSAGPVPGGVSTWLHRAEPACGGRGAAL